MRKVPTGMCDKAEWARRRPTTLPPASLKPHVSTTYLEHTLPLDQLVHVRGGYEGHPAPHQRRQPRLGREEQTPPTSQAVHPFHARSGRVRPPVGRALPPAAGGDHGVNGRQHRCRRIGRRPCAALRTTNSREQGIPSSAAGERGRSRGRGGGGTPQEGRPAAISAGPRRLTRPAGGVATVDAASRGVGDAQGAAVEERRVHGYTPFCRRLAVAVAVAVAGVAAKWPRRSAALTSAAVMLRNEAFNRSRTVPMADTWCNVPTKESDHVQVEDPSPRLAWGALRLPSLSARPTATTV